MRLSRTQKTSIPKNKEQRTARARRAVTSSFVFQGDTREDLTRKLTPRRRKRTVVDALVGSGIDASTVNDIRNMTLFLITSLEDAVIDGAVSDHAIHALRKCEDLFEQVVFHSTDQFHDDLLVSVRNFMMEAQAVLEILEPYAQNSTIFATHDKDTLEAKLFVLNYLASSIDSYFSSQL